MQDKPLIDSKFFSFWKPEDAITELKYIEKITYIAIPIMIFINLVFYISYLNTNIWNDNLTHFFGNISKERLFTITMIVNAFLTPLLNLLSYFYHDLSDFILLKISLLLLKQKLTK